MGKRRKAREIAVQALYQIEAGGSCEGEVDFWMEPDIEEDVRNFAAGLVTGTMDNLAHIDKLLASHSDNWQLSRFSQVDHSILRMAVYELTFRDDIPPAVSINEAIEIAKKYGSEKSGQFVNGVLDAIKKAIDVNPPM